MTPMTVDRAKACGLEVQKLRKLQGMTQADLAEALEVDRGTISHIESGGRKATKIQRVAIADALHVDEEWLLNPPLPLTFQMGPPPSPDEQAAQNPDGTLPFEHPSRIATVTRLRPKRPDDRRETAGRERTGRAA